MIGTVEAYAELGRHDTSTMEVREGTLAAVVTQLLPSWSATLTLDGEEQTLIVSFASGAASVLLMAGADEFHDLIGVARRLGVVPFVSGGQQADVPARHIVSAAQCTATLEEFARTGRIRPEIPRWERQGDLDV